MRQRRLHRARQRRRMTSEGGAYPVMEASMPVAFAIAGSRSAAYAAMPRRGMWRVALRASLWVSFVASFVASFAALFGASLIVAPIAYGAEPAQGTSTPGTPALGTTAS